MNLILDTKSVHHVIGENSNDIFVSLFLKTILIFYGYEKLLIDRIKY